MECGEETVITQWLIFPHFEEAFAPAEPVVCTHECKVLYHAAMTSKRPGPAGWLHAMRFLVFAHNKWMQRAKAVGGTWASLMRHMSFIHLVDQWRRGANGIYDLLRLIENLRNKTFREETALMRMDVMIIYLIEQ